MTIDKYLQTIPTVRTVGGREDGGKIPQVDGELTIIKNFLYMIRIKQFQEYYFATIFVY